MVRVARLFHFHAEDYMYFAHVSVNGRQEDTHQTASTSPVHPPIYPCSVPWEMETTARRKKSKSLGVVSQQVTVPTWEGVCTRESLKCEEILNMILINTLTTVLGFLVLGIGPGYRENEKCLLWHEEGEEVEHPHQ